MTVGNLVFKDLASNSKFDALDTGVSGVTVKLFAIGADPQTSVATATTVTGTNGTFTIAAYAEGDYFLHIPKAMFATTGPLKGLTSSPGFATEAGDDNVNENGLDTTVPSVSGVNSTVFYLGYGSLPVDSTSEKGFLASADNTTDSNGDLTIDFGFRVPPLGTPLAGQVRRDLNGDGTSTTADAPLAGVQVSAFVDTNHNGILDPEEMTATATTTSISDGTYLIEGLKSEVYIVQAEPVPGSVAVSDSDGGRPDQTSVVLGEKPVTYINFLQCLCPDTFSQWQAQHGLSGNNSASGNLDSDGADNLMEYALGTDPASGVQPVSHFRLDATPAIDAVLIRQQQGHNDLHYIVEGSIDAKQWTKLSITPTTSSSGDEETLRFAAISTDSVFSASTVGYVRLRVDLDADLNGTAEATSYSPVYAFALRSFGASQTTMSMPLLRDAIFTGTVSAVGDSSLSINDGTGLKLALGTGRECFAEVVSGELAGQSFDLDEAATTDKQLAIDMASTRNTTSSLNASLLGASIVVRPHWTLGSVLPVTSFHATTSANTADRVSFFENGGYAVHWALARTTGSQWIRAADTSGANTGRTRIITAGEGFYVQARSGKVSIPLVGQLRTTPLLRKVATSLQMIGSGSAQSIAISSLSWTSTGDKIRLWVGDSILGSTAFDALTKTTEGWTHDIDGAAANDALLFAPFRAVFHEPVK